MEKGPTLADHSESPSGPMVLIQVANLWFCQGQPPGNQQRRWGPRHLPAILNQKLLLLLVYWED